MNKEWLKHFNLWSWCFRRRPNTITPKFSTATLGRKTKNVRNCFVFDNLCKFIAMKISANDRLNEKMPSIRLVDSTYLHAWWWDLSAKVERNVFFAFLASIVEGIKGTETAFFWNIRVFSRTCKCHCALFGFSFRLGRQPCILFCVFPFPAFPA